MTGGALTVLQLVPALHGGGVERGVLEIARELVRCGHRALVISAGGAWVKTLEQTGARHIAWPIGVKAPWTLRLVPRLASLLRREAVDILHARSRLPAWVGYWAWRAQAQPRRTHFVTTVHGLYSINRYSAVMTRGERVIAVSDTVHDHLRHHYPRLAPERIRVIPRGIAPHEFPYGYRPDAAWFARWHAEHPALVDTPLITLAGRITRTKGLDDFVDLMARLRTHGTHVHGLLVGPCEARHRGYLRAWQRRVAALGLKDRITWLGARTDLRELYACSRLVLSLSQQPESFGRSPLEALSLGIPVIGYAHGGVGEILQNVYPAGRVVPGDIDALEARVAQLMQQAPLPPRAHAYPLQRMLNATLAVYHELAAC